jgi:hypothetical protein
MRAVPSSDAIANNVQPGVIDLAIALCFSDHCDAIAVQ